MPNAAARAIALMQRTVARQTGLSVRYQSAGTELIGILATPAQVSAEVLAEEELGVRAIAQDWFLNTADLVFAGSRRKPLVGDRIVVKDPAGDRTFEVCPLGRSSHFKPADRFGLQWRIHSKQIEGNI